jgi:hypothetical protein
VPNHYENDPYVSSRQQAERDAFGARARLIRLSIVGVVALAAVACWFLFR